MKNIETWPSEELLKERYAATPTYMNPSLVPYAAVLEGFLSDADCSSIIRMTHSLVSYQAKDCGALTTEVAFDPSLDPIEATARGLNAIYWNYDLHDGQTSWIQKYGPGGSYQRHMDGAPGQTRKLTAVAMLSEPSQYVGGELKLYVTPKRFKVPKTRGTIVVFDSWVDHEVTEVRKGERQTVNMGFWGPAFR